MIGQPTNIASAGLLPVNSVHSVATCGLWMDMDGVMSLSDMHIRSAEDLQGIRQSLMRIEQIMQSLTGHLDSIYDRLNAGGH